MLDICKLCNSAGAKRSAWETSRQELSEDASFGVAPLLVVEQSGLENRLGGVCDIHRRRLGGGLTSVMFRLLRRC